MRQANVEKKTAFLHKENGSTIQVWNNERCSLLCNSYFPTLVLPRSGPKGMFSVLRVKSERTPTKIIFIQLSNSGYSLFRIITEFPIQFQCYNDCTRKSREKFNVSLPIPLFLPPIYLPRQPEAAIHPQTGAGNIIRRIGAEKRCRFSDILNCSQSTPR